MKISEIINHDSIVLDLHIDSKEHLIEKMIELAAKSGKILNVEQVLQEVLEREKIMSTGVGKNIALPHAKTNAVSDCVGALALLHKPMEYDALDGEPVNLVFLLLGKENNVGVHLRLLSKVSRLMNNDTFRLQLFDCHSADEILEMFDKMEEN